MRNCCIDDSPSILHCSQTREELRNALEDETRAFNVDKDLSSSYVISWNHQEFEVQYNSLADEIKIGACNSLKVIVVIVTAVVGVIRSAIVARWTAGQQVERSILHQEHDSQQNSSH